MQRPPLCLFALVDDYSPLASADIWRTRLGGERPLPGAKRTNATPARSSARRAAIFFFWSGCSLTRGGWPRPPACERSAPFGAKPRRAGVRGSGERTNRLLNTCVTSRAHHFESLRQLSAKDGRLLAAHLPPRPCGGPPGDRPAKRCFRQGPWLDRSNRAAPGRTGREQADRTGSSSPPSVPVRPRLPPGRAEERGAGGGRGGRH